MVRQTNLLSIRPTILVRLVVLLATLAVANPIASAKPGGPAGTNGAYKIACKGSYEGDGNAAVGANSVNIVLHIKNPETGVAGTLHASNLDLDDGRFSGTGTFAGNSVQISGRVEAPDGKFVLKARIMGQFEVSDGLLGKFAGDRKGP